MLKKDIEVLRRLADQLAELSQLPIQKERKQQWYHLNARKVDKPVFLMGEFPWNEMNIDDELTLQCEDPFYREMETTLRQLLYRNKHIQDDWVYEPFIYIPKVIRGLNFGLDIIEEKLTRDDGNVVEAHSYFSQLQDWDDINKINVPNFYLDEEETNRREAMANEAVGDILKVIMDGPEYEYRPWDHFMEWSDIDTLYDKMLYDEDWVHALMRRTLDVHLATINKLKDMDCLMRQQQVVHCTGAWTDLLPENPEKPELKDVWTYGMAQILYTVSPEMHNEFEFQYASEWYDKFGLGYYGCCEPLDDRMEYVKQIKGIHKISVSAWVKDFEKMAEAMEGKYVYSNKPAPALIAAPSWNPETVEEDLKIRLHAAQKYNCPVEFTLKDISTICYEPQRLTQWSQIMRKVIG